MADPTVELILSTFKYLPITLKQKTLIGLLQSIDWCPRCLTPYEYKEERDARICGACVRNLQWKGEDRG